MTWYEIYCHQLESMPQKGIPETTTTVSRQFGWSAFLIGPFWLFAQGLWLHSFGLLSIWIILGSVSATLPLLAVFSIFFGLQLIVGYEACYFAALSLRRQGYHLVGIIGAPNKEALSLRMAVGDIAFFDTLSSGPSNSSKGHPVSSPAQSSDVVGLFPEPRGYK